MLENYCYGIKEVSRISIIPCSNSSQLFIFFTRGINCRLSLVKVILLPILARRGHINSPLKSLTARKSGLTQRENKANTKGPSQAYMTPDIDTKIKGSHSYPRPIAIIGNWGTNIIKKGKSFLLLVITDKVR